MHVQRSTRFAALLALALTLTLAGGVSAAGRPLGATLLGVNEVSGGDPDGSGSARVWVNQGQEEVCFVIEVADVAPITAAHVHRASAGVNGPVVVNFNVVTNGLSGCVSATAALIKEIRQSPDEFYVNVHNASFPGGALRGQLHK